MTLRRLLVAQFVLQMTLRTWLIAYVWFLSSLKNSVKGLKKASEPKISKYSIHHSPSLAFPSLQCMWIALFVSVLFYHSSNFFKGKVWSRKSIALCLRLSKVLRFEIPKRNLTKIAFKWVINPTTNDAILNFVYQVAYLGRYGQSLTLFFTS